MFSVDTRGFFVDVLVLVLEFWVAWRYPGYEGRSYGVLSRADMKDTLSLWGQFLRFVDPNYNILIIIVTIGNECCVAVVSSQQSSFLSTKIW